MSKKKEKENEIDFTKLSTDELMKYEIAAELGIFDRVIENGWRSLTARETGRIGGMVTQRKKEMLKKQQENEEQ